MPLQAAGKINTLATLQCQMVNKADLFAGWTGSSRHELNCV